MLTNIELQFEHTLAFHCAPAMAGIKPADMISWSKSGVNCRQLIEYYANRLSQSGICFHILCCRQDRYLILVFRENRLSAQLAQPEVSAQLHRDGYPVDGTLTDMLTCLGERLAQLDSFPHEIGLFLGYPIEDVEGFRKNAGRNFKLSGLWKVYSDVERAQACFYRYDRCRRGLCRRLAAGMCLCRLFGAA